MNRSEGAGVFRVAWWVVAAVLLQACGDTALAEPAVQEPRARAESLSDSQDILARLQSLQGVTVIDERPSPITGTRFFRLVVDQPADHARPLGERFQLRVNLLHRSESAPMVLASGGYGLGNAPGRTEPTRLPELRGVGLPTLVVQGERDPMGRPEEFPADVAGLDLVVVPGADHGLKVPARGEVSQDEAMGIVVESTLEWLVREVVGNPRAG